MGCSQVTLAHGQSVDGWLDGSVTCSVDSSVAGTPLDDSETKGGREDDPEETGLSVVSKESVARAPEVDEDPDEPLETSVTKSPSSS